MIGEKTGNYIRSIEAPTTEEGWDELEAAITATLTAAAESRWDR